MIPVLYESSETSFTNNGIGALTDCISCLVTEERNGQFEVEFTYPITGVRYAEILEGRIICVTHDEQMDKQPFIIYRRSAPLNGVVTFNAHHYSYLLSGIAVSPFTATSVADAFQQISSHSMITNPFTFWTDNTTGGSMDIDVPMSARALLGGTRGTVLDVFGGEYEFDKLTVKNYAHRGTNNGVTIRYGKNLTKLDQIIDAEFLPNAAVPFWKGSDDTVVYGAVTAATGQTATRVTVMDLSQDFDEQPSAAQLQTKAKAKLDANTPWIPSENIKVDFVALWQTEEFKDVAPLQRVQLCDTVSIYYPELGVNATAKVIKVVWDALLDRYDSMELGQAQSSFADTILSETDARFDAIDEALKGVATTSMMDAAIAHATDLITGGLGGYVVTGTNADGEPNEILIMDNPNKSQAVNVLRMNKNGIGFSSTGYSGTYTTAWTIDSHFNADFITAGTMQANRIKGGTLTMGGSGNGNGVIVVKNASNTEIGRWDNTGLTATGDLIIKKSDTISGSTVTVTGGVKKFTVEYLLQTSTSIQTKDVLGIGVESSSDSGGYNVVATDGTYIKTAGRYCYDVKKIANKMLVSTVFDSTTMTYSRVFRNLTSSTSFQVYVSTDLMVSAYVNVTATSITLGDTNNTARFYTSVQSRFGSGANGSAIDGRYIQFQGSSSRRYKHDITEEISKELDPHKLYELPMKQFVFNFDHKTEFEGMDGATLPGFIAEEVAEIYPAAVIYKDGEVESWDERRIIPGMLKLIQEQHEEIEDLKKRVDRLEQLIERMEAKL